MAPEDRLAANRRIYKASETPVPSVLKSKRRNYDADTPIEPSTAKRAKRNHQSDQGLINNAPLPERRIEEENEEPRGLSDHESMEVEEDDEQNFSPGSSHLNYNSDNKSASSNDDRSVEIQAESPSDTVQRMEVEKVRPQASSSRTENRDKSSQKKGKEKAT